MMTEPKKTVPVETQDRPTAPAETLSELDKLVVAFIDGALDVFDVIRLPGGKVRLSNKSAEFECNITDIMPAGVVVFTLEKHV